MATVFTLRGPHGSALRGPDGAALRGPLPEALAVAAVAAVTEAVEQLPADQWRTAADVAEELGKSLATLAATYALDITDPGYQLMLGLVTWILLRLAPQTLREPPG